MKRNCENPLLAPVLAGAFPALIQSWWYHDAFADVAPVACMRHLKVLRHGKQVSKSLSVWHLQACMVSETLSCERNGSPQDRLGSAGSTSASTSRSTSDVMWTRCLLFISALFAPIATGKRSSFSFTNHSRVLLKWTSNCSNRKTVRLWLGSIYWAPTASSLLTNVKHAQLTWILDSKANTGGHTAMYYWLADTLWIEQFHG